MSNWKRTLLDGKVRPVSAIMLLLAAASSVNAIGSLRIDAGIQFYRDIFALLFFPLSLLLYFLSWRSFIVLNVAVLAWLLAISVFLMVTSVDPLMGLMYVLLLLFLALLLLREGARNWNSHPPSSVGAKHP